MKKGFTLIELLVVITIIGILAAGATAVYSGAQAKARDAQRQTDVVSLSTAETYYLADNDTYVATVGSLVQYIGDAGVKAPTTSDASATMASAYAGGINPSSSTPAYAIGACGMKAGNTASIGVATTNGAFVKTAGVVGAVTVTCAATKAATVIAGASAGTALTGL